MAAVARLGTAVPDRRLEMWHAVVLLVVHGSQAFWHPSGQLLIHDIVGTRTMQSAIAFPLRRATSGCCSAPRWVGPC